jgi:RNA polymerase sigma-70 factor (ECF subfamily)
MNNENAIQSDLDLAARVASRCAMAENEFYDRFKPHVGALLHDFPKSAPLDHEDLVQTTFIKLFEKINTFKGESKLGTWVHRVARNEGLMYLRNYRTRVARRTASGDEALRPLHASRLDSPARVIDRITIENAMRRLAPGYRAALFLHDVEGYEHKEIAERMNSHEGTSKSQLSRARSKMRQMIN